MKRAVNTKNYFEVSVMRLLLSKQSLVFSICASVILSSSVDTQPL